MDDLTLQILDAELCAESEILSDAARRAGEHLHNTGRGHLEACGFELNRFYNVIEKCMERVCAAFENHFDKRGDYHERLLARAALDLPGIRPAFVPAPAVPMLRDLKGFRHVFRHAYVLEFRADRLEELVRTAEHIAVSFPVWVEAFRAAASSEDKDFR